MTRSSRRVTPQKRFRLCFLFGGNPVLAGFVDNIARPNGNLTGATLMTEGLETKRFQLMKTLLPTAKRIAFLIDPSRKPAKKQRQEAADAAAALGIDILIVESTTSATLAPAFSTIAKSSAAGLVIGANPRFFAQRHQIVGLIKKHNLPTVFTQPEYVELGGLMSYGTDIYEVYRQVGLYAGRILNGTKPRNLPVRYPSKFKLVVNTKAAKKLGLALPPSFLAQADAIVE